VAGCGDARPADSDKDAGAVTHLFGQKASLVFVGANGGLLTQSFEPLLCTRVRSGKSSKIRPKSAKKISGKKRPTRLGQLKTAREVKLEKK